MCGMCCFFSLKGSQHFLNTAGEIKEQNIKYVCHQLGNPPVRGQA